MKVNVYRLPAQNAVNKKQDAEYQGTVIKLVSGPRGAFAIVQDEAGLLMEVPIQHLQAVADKVIKKPSPKN